MLGRKQDYTISYAQPPVIGAEARIIQIDPAAAEIGRNRGVTVGIVGDIEAVVEQMTQEAKTKPGRRCPGSSSSRLSRKRMGLGWTAWPSRSNRCTHVRA